MTLEERQIEQEKVVAVLTSNHEDMKEDIANLKQGQKDLSDKMDTGLLNGQQSDRKIKNTSACALPACAWCYARDWASP